MSRDRTETRPDAWWAAGLALALLFAPHLGAQEAEPETKLEPETELEPVVVQGQRVANPHPAATYATLVTALRYDPVIQVQPRGLPEAQADVTVRGGLFENTGFRIGALTIIDPQTGHYAAEFPIDPAMLTAPGLLTDTANAVLGVNANVATVQYGLRPIRSGGEVLAGAGSDDLWFGRARLAATRELDDGREAGFEVAAAGSTGDGTVPFGDHDFERYTARLSLSGPGSETQVLAGYHDTFYGWPGAYTGFGFLPETDRTRLSLVLADYRREHDSGWWEVTAAWRRLEDDYDFDRDTTESGVPGSFDHETRAASVGLSGVETVRGIDWRFNLQFTADRLVDSTDLTGGDFGSRSTVAASLAPTFRRSLGSGAKLEISPGVRVDWSNRDEDSVSPLVGVMYRRANDTAEHRLSFDYARTSQLPGYTALKSPPAGLFGGNPGLEREYADTVTLTGEREQGDWTLRAAVFHRRDRDLVDWTFLAGAPFARQANPVDIDVDGIEGSVRWSTDRFWALGAIAWLDKDADYGEAAVDASYYALNFAKVRATLALAWRITQGVELRADNAWREAEENPLRTTGRHSWQSALSLSWCPTVLTGTEWVLAVDNLTDDDFQEFPGAPAAGRQWSVSLRYGW